MALLWRNPGHRQLLADWLLWADTLVGWNIRFDLLYLRHCDKVIRQRLSGRHLLIDGMNLNFSHNEGRPEKSLKDVVKVRGIAEYEDDARDHRFKNDTSRDLWDYNAQDTVNTINQCVDLASAIRTDYPDSAKLSPRRFHYDSDAIWEAVTLEEAGVPMSMTRLRTVDAYQSQRVEETSRRLREEYGVVVTCHHSHERCSKGDCRCGPQKSQTAALQGIFDFLHDHPQVPSLIEERGGITSHPCFQLTKGGKSGLNKKLSISAMNRLLAQKVLELLEPTDDVLRYLDLLMLWNCWAKAADTLSDYCTPLLRERTVRKGSKGHPEDTKLLPNPLAHHPGPFIFSKSSHDPDVALAFPSWYITPGFAGKDAEIGRAHV